MVITFLIAGIMAAIVMLYMRQDKFGQAPRGERLEKMKQSPHFQNGRFQNLSPTPGLTEGHTYAGVIRKQLLNRLPRRRPTDIIPAVKTDFGTIPPDSNGVVWFGHSSYFMQIDGKKILVDPVFSGNASPIPGTARSFAGSDQYAANDLPAIDYLFITHDHYDHADYETLIALKSKVKQVICGLGVGAHLEYWGYSVSKIIEKDWYEHALLDTGFIAYAEPARHFSGRGFSRNITLWASFILQTPTMKIYIGGDSGYDSHYAAIGRKYGPIDLAILENGQYDEAWKYIHHQPEEVLKAAQDLKAKRILPVHSSKFAIANHTWDEPLIKLTELNKSYQIPILTPRIGEWVNLNDSLPHFSAWWEGVK